MFAMSSVIRVFDPPMCCSSGVCGPSVDPQIARFASDVDWLRTQGIAVERYGLSTQPAVFVSTPAVKAAMAAHGTRALPLVMVGEQVAVVGSYPSREALAALAGVAYRKLDVVPGASVCCTPGESSAGPKDRGC
jgi:hypothetical protein